TTDYLAETLGLKGGSARPVIPFLKKLGMLGADGVPTDLYKRFRNPAVSGIAAAEALRIAYKPLFQINENVHKASDAELKGAVLQATGLDHDSRAVSAIVASFKQLKSRASFDAAPEATPPATPATPTLPEVRLPNSPDPE